MKGTFTFCLPFTGYRHGPNSEGHCVSSVSKDLGTIHRLLCSSYILFQGFVVVVVVAFSTNMLWKDILRRAEDTAQWCLPNIHRPYFPIQGPKPNIQKYLIFFVTFHTNTNSILQLAQFICLALFHLCFCYLNIFLRVQQDRQKHRQCNALVT